MPIREPPELVDFDVDAALEAGMAAAGDGILTAVEYVAGEFNVVYVDDEIVAMYEDRDHMERHFGEIAEKRHVDTHEQDLFERELSDLGDVQYFVTRMDFAAFGRLVTSDGQGLWVTLSPAAPVVETMEAIRERVHGTPEEYLYEA